MTTEKESRLQNIISWYESKIDDYEKFGNLILDKINRALRERNIFVASAISRAKSIESFRNKCQKTVYDETEGNYVEKYTDPKNQIMDCAGVRIVAYLKSDIPLIQEIIERMFEIDYKNSQDKAELLSGDKVGYLSVHYIASLNECSLDERKFKNFKCEIQVRTLLQDAWAQIFHDRQYKRDSNISDISYELKRKTSLVAGTLELIDQQINDLAEQYDALSKGISNTEYQHLLDEIITADSLVKYFIVKFNNKANKFFNSNSCLQWLQKLKMTSIRDLDNVVTEDFVNAVSSYVRQLTVDKLLAYILIVYNYEKYFSITGNSSIKTITDDSYRLLDKFVDMSKICLTYNIAHSE